MKKWIVGGVAAGATAVALSTATLITNITEEPSVTVEAPVPSADTAEIVNGTFVCQNELIDYDLVRVTNTDGVQRDAVSFRAGCQGHIRRWEIMYDCLDGAKVQNASPTNPARNITVDEGYVISTGICQGAHQDAIQIMGGKSITIRNTVFSGNGFSDWYSSLAGGLADDCNTGDPAACPYQPTDVVCDGCTFKSGSISGPGAPLRIGWSLRSGARNSIVCAQKASITARATSPVNENNTFLPKTDARCKP